MENPVIVNIITVIHNEIDFFLFAYTVPSIYTNSNLNVIIFIGIRKLRLSFHVITPLICKKTK